MRLKLKRYYKLIVLLALLSWVLIAGWGDQPIVAYTVADNEQVAEQVLNYHDAVARFDTTVVQVYFGGSSTGTESDGLYQDGAYSPSGQSTSFTLSGIVTQLGGRSRW